MTQEIRSILAAVDRNGRSQQVAARAVALARLTRAHLELFLCDAERAFNRRHQYEPQAAERAKEDCLVGSRRYLESLRGSLEAPDMHISLSVACESPLYEGIVHAVARCRPDLVVRGGGVRAASDNGHLMGARHIASASARPADTVGATAALDANDFELVRTCPVPLLLTRGKSWKDRPVVAAAVDLSPSESAELTRTILRTAARLAVMMGGVLEVVHARAFDGASPSEIDAQRLALEERVSGAGVEAAECHLIVGEPAIALPAYAARRGYDLMVLGSLTHRKALTALVGTLTGRLIETLDNDFLLVKSPAGQMGSAT